MFLLHFGQFAEVMLVARAKENERDAGQTNAYAAKRKLHKRARKVIAGAGSVQERKRYLALVLHFHFILHSFIFPTGEGENESAGLKISN